jgi:hypothetical protein
MIEFRIFFRVPPPPTRQSSKMEFESHEEQNFIACMHERSSQSFFGCCFCVSFLYYRIGGTKVSINMVKACYLN